MLKKIGGFILGIIALFGMGIVFANIIPDATENQQKNECLQWNAWAKERPVVFYLTSAQKKQCDTLNIEINAMIKGGTNE